MFFLTAIDQFLLIPIILIEKFIVVYWLFKHLFQDEFSIILLVVSKTSGLFKHKYRRHDLKFTVTSFFRSKNMSYKFPENSFNVSMSQGGSDNLPPLDLPRPTPTSSFINNSINNSQRTPNLSSLNNTSSSANKTRSNGPTPDSNGMNSFRGSFKYNKGVSMGILQGLINQAFGKQSALLFLHLKPRKHQNTQIEWWWFFQCAKERLAAKQVVNSAKNGNRASRTRP